MSYKKNFGANECHKQRSPCILKTLKFFLNKKFIRLFFFFFLPKFFIMGIMLLQMERACQLGYKRRFKKEIVLPSTVTLSSVLALC